MSQDVTHNAFDQNDDVAIEAFGPAWNTDKIRADCQVSATVSDGIYSTVSLTMGPLGRHSTPTSHPALRGVGLPTKAMPTQPIVKELSRHKTLRVNLNQGR